MKKKKVMISAGPIPAKLDSVKYLTNMFKGGLALVTASYLASQPDFEVTLVMWTHADKTHVPASVKALVTVDDVFEYYDWVTAHARDFDAFVMAAAVANLTPVHPYAGKFPSHEYRPGDEFDIRFMIAPRAIDAVKPLNSRACLIGYKLFDEPDDGKLAGIARHTLEDSRANVVFANRPHEAKSRKIAVTADGSVIPMGFKDHLEFMARAIRQEYFATDAEPLTDEEKADPAIREALATVSMYEHTFDGYGTVGVPVENRPGLMATTSRGHKSGPVLVRDVDGAAGIVEASGKATLNAPALYAVLKDHNWSGIMVHRHFTDPLADKALTGRHDAAGFDAGDYIFPGTFDEFDEAKAATVDDRTGWLQPFHGYVAWRPAVPVDWTRYHELFPGKYFTLQGEIVDAVKAYRAAGRDVLEIGGNRHPLGNWSYDPYAEPDNGTKTASWEDVTSRHWPLAVCFNAVNYLSEDEIMEVLRHCGAFAANTFRAAPDEKVTDAEYAVRCDGGAGPMVRHGLRLPDDGLMRHAFHAYTKQDFEAMGLSCWEYGTSSMAVFKGLGASLCRNGLTEYAESIAATKGGSGA